MDFPPCEVDKRAHSEVIVLEYWNMSDPPPPPNEEPATDNPIIIPAWYMSI